MLFWVDNGKNATYPYEQLQGVTLDNVRKLIIH